MKFYHVSLDINGFDPNKVLLIKQAVNDVCVFNNWFIPYATQEGVVMQASCETMVDAPSDKSSKETAEELALKIASKVWSANGGYCGVHVGANCLSDKPEFVFDVDTAIKEIF